MEKVMSKYLVTGGAGFIGSNLVQQLLNDGNQVVVVDDLSTGFLKYLPLDNALLTFLQIDITDWSALTKHAAYFKGVDGVFHLAACARIQPSIMQPGLTHDTNATGTLNILELMKMLEITDIVYSASSSYYGLKAKVPSFEDDPSDCQTPYSLSKYFGEYLCSTWSKVYGINSIRLRYFNVWGPRSPMNGPYAPVVLRFMKQALENTDITVVGDGSQRRDFTYITDVVAANIAAMSYMSNKFTSVDQTINIGTGRNYSILELANLVKDAVRSDYYKFTDSKIYESLVRPPDCNIVHVPERIGEAKLSLADNQKAKLFLKWEPKIRLEDKLSEVIEYVKGELKNG
jgi:UDP-glucose 4-epimerase